MTFSEKNALVDWVSLLPNDDIEVLLGPYADIPTSTPPLVQARSAKEVPTRGGFASVSFKIPDSRWSSSSCPSSSSPSLCTRREEAFHSIVQHLRSILLLVTFLCPFSSIFAFLRTFLEIHFVLFF